MKQDHTQSVFHTFMSVFTLATRYLAIIFASPSLRDHTCCKLCTPLRSTAVPGLSVAMLSRAQKARVCRTYPTGMMYCLNKLGVGYRINGARPYIYIFPGTSQADSPVYTTSVDQYKHLYAIKIVESKTMQSQNPEVCTVYTRSARGLNTWMASKQQKQQQQYIPYDTMYLYQYL